MRRGIPLPARETSSPRTADNGVRVVCARLKGSTFTRSACTESASPLRGEEWRGANRRVTRLARGAAVLAASFVLAACASGPKQIATPIAVDAGQTAALVSAYRAENRLPPVGLDSRLMQAAATQARAMGERDRIGHKVAGALPRRVSATGYDWGAAAENLGAGYPSLQAAMQGWKDSGEHRRNLLNPRVTEIGVAAVATPPGSQHRTYWALILAGPRPEPSAAGPFAMDRP